MTPAEQLAAARANVVGPYLPAREEWLEKWVGPCSPDNCDDSDVAICDGQIVDDRWVGAPNGIRLDVHRPEVRDHIVRLGCPEWARDVPAAVWCWGMGVDVKAALGGWFTHPWDPTRKRQTIACDHLHMHWPFVDADGWRLPTFPGGRPGPHRASGPETGDLGRACADLAALNAGCILREPGGWLVPMPDGGIGFFEEVSRDE